MADKSWDNTGLLVESSNAHEVPKILLTIDLTQSVADEAISKNVNFIIAYHPFIFRGLKSITSNDPQQRSLIKLIQNNINVYCPHTAVDSAKGGVNDFLVDGITKSYKVESSTPIEQDSNEPDCGMGRLVKLQNPVGLQELVANVKSLLGLKYVQVATSDKKKQISSIAVCAGSGGGVFKTVKADLYYTGELSHHEALYFKELGSAVICCNHSNTERAFLKVIQQQLRDELQVEDQQVLISETDKDPLETW